MSKVTDNISSDLQEYLKGLKSGYSYSIDVAYYWSGKAGLGFKYDVFRSHNEIENVYLTRPAGSGQCGKLSDDISNSFIGPFYSSRFLTANKKNSLFLNLELGYVGYKDDAVIISDYTITGGTAGILVDIGYDIGLSKSLALGFQVSYLGGT